MAALAVALLAATTLAGWAGVRSASTTLSVVGARETITRGAVIDRNDLTVVEVGQASGLRTIPADQIAAVVGRRAATDIPAGSVVPPNSVNDALMPARQNSLVGILVGSGGAPLTGLTAGARVRLVPLPASQQAQQGSATSSVKEASAPVTGTVVAVSPAADGNGSRVDVNVAAVDAAGVQVLAAQNRISVVVDSQER